MLVSFRPQNLRFWGLRPQNLRFWGLGTPKSQILGSWDPKICDFGVRGTPGGGPGTPGGGPGPPPGGPGPPPGVPPGPGPEVQGLDPDPGPPVQGLGLAPAPAVRKVKNPRRGFFTFRTAGAGARPDPRPGVRWNFFEVPRPPDRNLDSGSGGLMIINIFGFPVTCTGHKKSMFLGSAGGQKWSISRKYLKGDYGPGPGPSGGQGPGPTEKPDFCSEDPEMLSLAPNSRTHRKNIPIKSRLCFSEQ